LFQIRDLTSRRGQGGGVSRRVQKRRTQNRKPKNENGCNSELTPFDLTVLTQPSGGIINRSSCPRGKKKIIPAVRKNCVLIVPFHSGDTEKYPPIKAGSNDHRAACLKDRLGGGPTDVLGRTCLPVQRGGDALGTKGKVREAYSSRWAGFRKREKNGCSRYFHLKEVTVSVWRTSKRLLDHDRRSSKPLGSRGVPTILRHSGKRG